MSLVDFGLDPGEPEEAPGEQFVCDVLHRCAGRPVGTEAHCMAAGEHSLTDPHLFGCGCMGLHERVFEERPGPYAVGEVEAAGHCDLAYREGCGGYALVHNDYVRVYPLDVERDDFERLAWDLRGVDWLVFWAGVQAPPALGTVRADDGPDALAARSAAVAEGVGDVVSHDEASSMSDHDSTEDADE